MKLAPYSVSASLPCRPRAGAWIETNYCCKGSGIFCVAPVRGRGLKPYARERGRELMRSPPCGGVD